MSDSLFEPREIIAFGANALAVADYDRIFLLDRAGELITVLGGPGKGPGEFKNIGGLALLSDGETMLVWDTGLLRLTWMAAGGQVLKTLQVTPPAGGFANAEDDINVRVAAGGLVLAWRPSLVGLGRQEEQLLTWLPLKETEEGQRLIARLPGYSWVDAGGIIVPLHPYGPRAIIAVASDGRVAHTDGVEYCIEVITVHISDTQLICREWRRAKVTEEDINPSRAGTLSEWETTLLEKRGRVAEFGDEKNSIEALRFDERGRLWVRVVDESVRYDEVLRGPHPELRPRTYLWDVYEISGRRLTVVRLDSRFDPLLFEGSKVYGSLITATGEYAIASISLPRELH